MILKGKMGITARVKCQKFRMASDSNSVNFFFFFVFLLFLWAAPAAYGGSQARGRIGAVATGLRQSHSNSGPEPRLQPTPQLRATPDR